MIINNINNILNINNNNNSILTIIGNRNNDFIYVQIIYK